ncbi:MAG: DUF1232 domain-containing protein [Candidatus Eremiobacteraeota bacterium]|nr:DUF1232 domain-containing protein [Candidatus Eremiobacteraeota bacterium]
MKFFRMISAAASEVPRLLPLMRDARVPLWSKVVAVLAVVLVVSPLNLLGDIPLIGLIDDGTLLLFVVHLFVKYAERSIA